MEVTRLGDSLFLSRQSQQFETIMNRHDIDTLVSVTSFQTPVTDFHIRLTDDHTNTLDDIHSAVEIVVSELEDGNRVLVYCTAGRSRSVIVCATALSIVKGTSVEQELDLISQKRVTQPNKIMVKQAETVKERFE